MKHSITRFTDVIDSRYAPGESVTLRYRNVVRFEPSESDDARFKELLQQTSIQEGLRTFPLLRYKGVEIHILDETSLMHTRTLKSIDGSVTTAKCLLHGHHRIVFESGGNTGMALTKYGQRVGLETFLVVPSDNLTLLDSPVFENESAHLIAVDDRREVKPYTAAFAARNGLVRVPEVGWRHQSSMLIGCFILEFILNNRRPDYLVQTISAAFAPIGIYTILERYSAEFRELPRFIGVQQEANCPMYRTWKQPSWQISAAEAPPSTAHLLTRAMYDGEPCTYGTFAELDRILRTTQGDLLTISVDEFQHILGRTFEGQTILELLANNGIDIAFRNGEPIEKTGLIAIAGALKKIDLGEIEMSSRVLVCLTSGTGRPDGQAIPELRIRGHQSHAG